MSQKTEKEDTCHGCLSINRNVTSIQRYYHIYKDIIGDVVNRSDKDIPLMCWECKALLKNVDIFKKRVIEANLYLKEKKNCQIKTLSKLNITCNQTIIDLFWTDYMQLIDIKCESLNNEGYLDTQTDESSVNNNFKENMNYEKIEKYKDENYIKEESLDYYEDIDIEGKESNRMVEKKKQKDKKKCKIIMLNLTHKTNLMYTRSRINEDERLYWSKQDQSKRNYRIMTFKCELCVVGFNKKDLYSRHMVRHTEAKGKYICDMCKIHYPLKSKLYRHIQEHFTKYSCNMCPFQCYRDYQIRTHLERAHKTVVECLKCGQRFQQRSDLHIHYRNLHTKLTCDYCGLNFKQRERLIKHIGKRHQKQKCEECGKTYKSLDGLQRHINLHHVKSERELCYCVECNIQFDNVTLFTTHLKNSVKHRARVSVPCPQCDRVYHRRVAMTNHYNLVHLNKSKYHCEPCGRYFLNGYRLRQHNEGTHKKLARIKNKMCPYCGRGFAVNRTLLNHIRIHTGEKPFACDYCPATFRQRQALVSHTRAIHNILNFK